MTKADKVIKRLEEENRTYHIQIIGDEKNKSQGFYILMNTQAFSSFGKEKYVGIKKKTLDLLDEAEIKYKVIK